MKRAASVSAAIFLCILLVCALLACEPNDDPTEVLFEVDYSAVKTTVYWGTDFDLTGLVVRVKLSTGVYRTLPRNENGYSVSNSGFDGQVPGVYTVTISYGEFAPVAFDMTVLDMLEEDAGIELMGISVKKNTGKRIFRIGEAFSSTGLALDFNYSDGSVKSNPSAAFEIDHSAYNSEKVGEYAIKISYLDEEEQKFSTVYTVYVVEGASL